MSKKVFLGGSCNPTTWRQDKAIPWLEGRGISFYNPQVDNWTPELVPIEAAAIKTAEVMFFVITGETAATASMVEVSLMIPTGRKLVLVVEDVPADSPLGNKDIIKDLNRGRAYLRNGAKEHGIPIYDSVDAALEATFP